MAAPQGWTRRLDCVEPERAQVLRREWTRRDAVGWAEFYGRSCAVSRIDWFPELATEMPLYPDRDRPGLPMRHTGIVSRSDLLDAFIRSEAEIRGEVEQDVLGRILGLDEGTVVVEVLDGAVTLRGHVLDRVLSRWSWASARASTVSPPRTPTSSPPGGLGRDYQRAD